MPAFFLSESDVAVVKRLLDEVERRGFNLRVNAPSRTPPRDILQTPGSYIAFSPYGETLPAMVGTTPGKLLCDIYRIIDTEEIGYEYGYLLPPYEYEYDSSQVVQVEELTQWVYNISDSPMSGSFLVHKDKYGYWLAGAGGGGGSGHETIEFTILSWCPGLATGTCECVVAEVTMISCGATSVRVGDEIVIWDPRLCWFNMPISVLVGMTGTANKMENRGIVGDVACPETPVDSSECIWIVEHLCCSEEVYA